MSAVKQRPGNRALRLNVGVTDALSKLIAFEILKPASCFADPVHIICRQSEIGRWSINCRRTVATLMAGVSVTMVFFGCVFLSLCRSLASARTAAKVCENRDVTPTWR
jgi:hypothetical protein